MATAMGSRQQTESAAIESRSRRSGRRRLALGLFVCFGGIALSFWLYWLLSARQRQLLETRFELDAKERIESIRRAVADRLESVQTIAALFAGSNLVERKEFSAFTKLWLENREGVRALAWAPRVPQARRPAHEQAVRGEGLPNYTITERNGEHNIVAAGERDEYYPILFVEPSQDSQLFLGFDIGSNPLYGAALRKAMATGRRTAAVCPPLDGNAARGNRLLLVEPARSKHSDLTKRPPDQPDIYGFVVGSFCINSIVKEAMGVFQPLGIDVYVYDSSGADDQTLVAVRLSSLHGPGVNLEPSPAQSGPPAAGMHFPMTIRVANRSWTIDCAAMDVYSTRQQTWEPLGTLLAGLVITALLAGYLLLSTGRTARVEQLVAERTRELRESEQRFRRLVDNASDAFFLRDEQGRIVDVNKWACDSLGYTREELLSMTVADIDVDFVPKNLARYARLPIEEYPVSFEGVQRRKDGSTFPVEIRTSPIIAGEERLMVSLVRDITGRKRNEEALRREQRLLRDMLDLHERDRQLVAYEIHDGLAQQLTGALYKLQSIQQAREVNPDAARQMFDEGMRLLREAMTECRRLISGLRPPILDEAGIVAAIDALVVEQRQRGGPEIDFLHREEIGRLAPPVESAAFRIVQECLTNACRYSQSPKVRVELQPVNGRIHIEVQDWGVGFDPEQIEGGHFGLQGIRQRARLLGGAATIQAAPGQGAHVIVELPLIPPADNGTA